MIEKEVEKEGKFEKENICNLLECTNLELINLSNQARSIFDENKSIYHVLLKILQQGYNIREATLVGLICGQLLGYNQAEEKIENEIKERLFKAFKNNSSL